MGPDKLSLSITDSNMQSRTVKLDIDQKSSQTFQINDMKYFQNDNLLFAGKIKKVL